MGIKQETIIDNRRDNTLLDALKRLLPYSEAMDVATGTFEMGSLLTLEEDWQRLNRIRIIMGDETTRRTREELIQVARQWADKSLEAEKERDDTLTGLAAIRDALAKKTIDVKVYTKAKFHAKCYIMDTGEISPVDFGIVGSSNFTRSGLTRNLELNLHTTDQLHIDKLREWYEAVWKQSEEISGELLSVIDPHLREYDPFTVYARALHEFFRGREKQQDQWEVEDSVIYKLLSKYQKDGYHRALQITEDWNGALICDGVGLGKTFIGLMILERCIRDGKRVLMIVPKAAQSSVWDLNINRYLRPKYRRYFKELFDLRLHTDFGRDGTISPEDFEYYKEHKQVIIIDEAHHFRNPKANRGQKLWELAKDKQLFMLTATPINNGLDDLYALINYFARDPKHFQRIRINNLRKYFLEAEGRLKEEHVNMDASEAADAEDFLRADELLQQVLIQRSRRFVKDSEALESDSVFFPERQRPQVIEYSLKGVYESIYSELKDAFDKDNPFLNLSIYNTSAYQQKPDSKVRQSQGQVIGLIRTLLLKRLESSFKSFEASVEDLLAKMSVFMQRYAPERYENWTTTNKRWWAIVQQHIQVRMEREEREPEEEDNVPEHEESDFDPEAHDMDKLLDDLQEDMRLLTDFLSKIYRRFYVPDKEGEVEDPSKDDKLKKLIKTLQDNELFEGNKVLIFTEFRQTARYLKRQLQEAGFEYVEQVDSARNVKNREQVIKRFAPYYNCYGQEKELTQALKSPINILISTDVLSEGLNLQDASLLINYDLHWNPVRLMQRLGRLDRRLNAEIEVILDRPADLNMKMYFWNFLPPKELDDLLRLKRNLDGKILRINRILGIEGALLTPDDPDMTIKEFNERYEKTETTFELMSRERQKIEKEFPDLWNALPGLPRRLFSGKAAGSGFEPVLDKAGTPLDLICANNRKGLFCCYSIPPAIAKATNDLIEHAKIENAQESEAPEEKLEAPGTVKWYFWDAETGSVSEDLREVWVSVRCTNDTPRTVQSGVAKLTKARKVIEEHIRHTYMKDVQVIAGAKPILVAWMEIN